MFLEGVIEDFSHHTGFIQYSQPLYHAHYVTIYNMSRTAC
jgi:hypothetical protein